MTSEKGHIRIGYFDSFKGKESILISSDIEGLVELEDMFLKLANGLSSFDFLNLKLLDKNFQIKLTAFNDKENIGLKQTFADTFEWRATKDKWNEFRENLTTMYRNGNSGHHYLNTAPADNNDLQVVFYWAENPLTIWEERRSLNSVKHEIWQDKEGKTTLCFANKQGDDCRKLLEPGSKLIHEFYANSHFDAMSIYYKFMNWGTYTTEFEIDKLPYDKKYTL